MVHRDDDISFFVPLFDIAVRLGRLFQRKARSITGFIFPASISSVRKKDLIFSPAGLKPVATNITFLPPMFVVHNAVEQYATVELAENWEISLRKPASSLEHPACICKKSPDIKKLNVPVLRCPLTRLTVANAV